MRVAPRALRIPISRVRSATDTSMMFMIPMPPTSRLTPAMLARSVVKTWEASCWVVSSCWRLRIRKSFSPPGEILVLAAQDALRVHHALLEGNAVGHLDTDGAQTVGAEDAIASRQQGNQDLLIGVPPGALRALLRRTRRRLRRGCRG